MKYVSVVNAGELKPGQLMQIEGGWARVKGLIGPGDGYALRVQLLGINGRVLAVHDLEFDSVCDKVLVLKEA